MVNGHVDLTKPQVEVLRFYMEALGPFAGDVVLTASRTSGLANGAQVERTQLVAEVPMTFVGGLGARFYGSLGDSTLERRAATNHEHQFVCTFDQRTNDAIELISFARRHHECLGALDVDHTFLLDDDNSLRRRGYTNVFVARADLFKPFASKNSAVLAGVPMTFFALVPLTPDEWLAKIENGTEGLFRHFEENNRDLLSLREPPFDVHAKS